MKIADQDGVMFEKGNIPVLDPRNQVDLDEHEE
jgi:hypothetical protein